MKILYAGDNRIRQNIGGRATSIALYQILEQRHEITGIITGNCTVEAAPVFYTRHCPRFIYSLLGRGRYRETLTKIWNLGIRTLCRPQTRFKRYSWVACDPRETSRRYHKCIAANPILKELDLESYDFDALVINGEGAMIMTEPPRIGSLIFLYLIWWAKKLRKKVFLVNVMFSDCPKTGRNQQTVRWCDEVLRHCDLIAVRDKESLQYCRKYLPGCGNVTFVPDALFTWYRYANNGETLKNGRYCLPQGNETKDIFDKVNFDIPYICVSGSSSAAWDSRAAVEPYCSMVRRLKKEVDMPVYLVQSCSGDAFLEEVARRTKTVFISADTPILALGKILQQARIFISGRYHPSILASLGGTPCIFLSSNSHKTRSLQEILGYSEICEYGALPSPGEVKKIIRDVHSLLRSQEERRAGILEAAENNAAEASRIIDLIV